MTSANLTVALPTADATVGGKTECRLSEDKMKDLAGNSSVAGYVCSFLNLNYKIDLRV